MAFNTNNTFYGDITGTVSATVVSKINGTPVAVPSGTNTVLTYNDGYLAWETPSAGFTAGGDLTGTNTSQKVIAIQSNPVSGTAATEGQLLIENAAANGSAWTSLSGDGYLSTFVPGLLTVTGSAGDFTVGGNLTVNGAETIVGASTFQSNASITGMLTVSDASTLSGGVLTPSIDANGKLSIGTNAGTTNAVHIGVNGIIDVSIDGVLLVNSYAQISLLNTAGIVTNNASGVLSTSVGADMQILQTTNSPNLTTTWVTVSGDASIADGGSITVNGLSGHALPALSAGNLNWTGSAWAFTASSGLPSGTGLVVVNSGVGSSVSMSGDATLDTTTGTITVVSAAGNFNVGGNLTASNLDVAAAGTLTIGGTNATSIILGNTTSSTVVTIPNIVHEVVSSDIPGIVVNDGAGNLGTSIGTHGQILQTVSPGFVPPTVNWVDIRGDVSFATTGFFVGGLIGQPLPRSTTGPGYLQWIEATNSWVFSSGSDIFTPGGDLTGTGTSQEVGGLLSNPLPSLSTGYLNYNGSVWSFDSPTVTSLVAGTNVSVSNASGAWTINSTVPNTSVVAASYGSATTFTNFTVGADGRLTAASNQSLPVTSLVAGSNVTVSNSSGAWTINAALATSGVSAGTYGSSTTYPVVTVDTYGRITSASSDNLPVTSLVAGTGVTVSNSSGAWTVNSTVAGLPSGTGLVAVNSGVGSALTMSGDATINTSTGALTLASITTASGPIGSTTTVPVITTDAKGRVTALSSAAIAFPTTLNLQTTITPSSYAALSTDCMIVCTQSAAITITLPVSPTAGNTYFVKDKSGTAITNNITVSGNGKNIDGASTYVISLNYESAGFVFDGLSWNIM